MLSEKIDVYVTYQDKKVLFKGFPKDCEVKDLCGQVDKQGFTGLNWGAMDVYFNGDDLDDDDTL